MNLITVDSLRYSYPGASTPALDGVSFRVSEGDYLAIVGANGSGKSTLARCLNGLLPPPPGAVSVAGFDPAIPSSRRDARKILSLVFQSPPDQIVASVAEEDVAFGLENLGVPRPEMVARVDEALAATGLLAERKRPPRFMSAGQQQRLAVAGVAAMRPRCVVFDEATSMIDPAGREDILGLMDRLVAGGTAVIHITHDMDEAARAKRILVLARGRVAFEGGADGLFARTDLASLSLALPESAQAAISVGLPPVPAETAIAFGARLTERRPNVGPSIAASSDEPDARGAVSQRFAFSLIKASLTYLAGGPNARLAVDAADLDIALGATVALVGPTGSGKSSLLQLMASLSFPDSGAVLHFGVDTRSRGVDPRAMRMRSPLSVQRPETAIFEFYAGDEAAFGPRNQGLKGPALVERVQAAFESVGLPYAEFRDRRARSLSGGEKRRLAIASVLAMDPEALLLDEPTSALDPVSKRAIMDMLFSWARKPGSRRTIVFATHSMEEAARADFVAVAGSGRVLAYGPPDKIFGESWDSAWGIARPFFASAIASKLDNKLDSAIAGGRA